MQTLIAYDLGTGGVKTSLFDAEGCPLASAFEPYDTLYPRPGFREQRPEDWWRAIVRSTRTALARAPGGGADVAALADSGPSLGVVPVDAEGRLPVHVTCEPHVLALAAGRAEPPRSRLNGCMAGAGFCFLAHDGRLQPCGFYEADGGSVRDFACDLPAAYRASPLFARLKGGPVCLARAAAQTR